MPGIIRALEKSNDLDLTKHIECNNFDYSQSAQPPWLLPSIKVYKNIFNSQKRNLGKSEITLKFNEFYSKYNNYTQIYTDGLLKDEWVGMGIYSESVSCHFRLPNEYTIFDAEIFGILTAIDIVLKRNQQNSIILTDSKSSIECLKKLFPKHPLLKKNTGLFGYNGQRSEYQFLLDPIT